MLCVVHYLYDVSDVATHSIDCVKIDNLTMNMVCHLNEKDMVIFSYAGIWRRDRDSNPGKVALQRFSRPPQSTALPSLRVQSYRNDVGYANIF